MKDLSQVSSAELRARLLGAIARLDASFQDAAACYCELFRRGEKTDFVSRGLGLSLFAVGQGKLVVAAALAFQHYPTLIAEVAKLPATEQEKLAAGGEVRIPKVNRAGEIIGVRVNAMEMTVAQIRRRFVGDGTVRTYAEQVKLLENEPSGAESKHRGEKLDVRYDPKKEEVIIGQIRVKVRDIAHAIAGDFKVERQRAKVDA